ncbi:MAG: hypothetical protein C0407_08600 [Desulfobacca sp.]|nr:hypothetical protein [Desulfobacca sp.]
MIKTPLPLLLLVAGLLVFLFLSSQTVADERPVEKLVSLPGFAPEWVLEDQVKIYSKDDLFTYINGEAELYFPYGFERLASAFYSKKGGDLQIGLTADIYKMGSLLDAFGIYAQYRKPDAEFITMGGEGFINPSQLIFYQDRYFVHLSASGTSQLEPSVFQACASAISRVLPGGKGQPWELDLLKIPALIPRTERYYPEGLLGYAFFRQGLIALAAQGEKKFRVFVMVENSAESAKKIVDQYARYVKESGLTPKRTTDPEGLMLFTTDPLHKGLMLKQKGRVIVGVVDLEGPDQGTLFIKQLLGRLPLPKP